MSNKLKGLFREAKGIFFTAVILIAVACFFFAAVNGASGKADSSSASTLEKAIKRAAVQCYAIEGFYPPDVGYLVDHYGIVVDSKYIVEYLAFSANDLPSIKILN